MKYEFTVMGEAKGQPRVKPFAVKMKDGSYRARVYTPGTAEEWKSKIAIAAKEAGIVGKMHKGWITIAISCYFQRPSSHFGTGKNAQAIKKSAPLYHTQTPDWDNIGKAATDALTTIGCWKDDKQIIVGVVSKNWTTAEPFTLFDISVE